MNLNIQMSVARVILPTIVVVDSDKSAEDQLRTMVTLYRYSPYKGHLIQVLSLK